jgi:hypothetical protein
MVEAAELEVPCEDDNPEALELDEERAGDERSHTRADDDDVGVLDLWLADERSGRSWSWRTPGASRG